MNKILLLLLTISTNLAFSQPTEKRIQNVENGLMLPTILTQKNEAGHKNILQKLKEHKVNGISVAVIHNGKLDWTKAYGVANADTKEPVTTNTLFQCASISKIITAIAALKLVENGLLSLDENVNNKLKRWKLKENDNTKAQSVSLRHLLSHSAGLTDEYGFLGYDPKNKIPTLLEILNNERPSNAKKALAVNAVPGEKEMYSGGGYLIVQLLIEDLTEMSFADYVQQQVFEVLQMTNTTYSNQPDISLGRPIATGHRSNGKTYKNKKYHIYPEKAAAGPWTTAEDLAKLVIAIQSAINKQDKAILNQELITEFITPQINQKGLGNNLKGIEKPKAFWHSGQNLGFTGLLYGLIEEGEGAIVLVNSEGGEILIQEFITSVANAYDWPVMKSYDALEISERLKSQLVGSYENSNQQKNFSIEQKNHKLMMKSASSKGSFQLYRIGENRYTFKDAQDYYKLVFKFKNEKVVSLMYNESIGKTIELKKLE
ncbi:MAG: serine hydrolase domain-containing protein [Bacteroidota bacterium]